MAQLAEVKLSNQIEQGATPLEVEAAPFDSRATPLEGSRCTRVARIARRGFNRGAVRGAGMKLDVFAKRIKLLQQLQVTVCAAALLR